MAVGTTAPQVSDWQTVDPGDWQNVAPSATPQPVPQQSHPLDSVKHAVGEWWDTVNPVTQVKGLASAISDPKKAAASMGQQNEQLWSRAKDAYSKGDYLGAAAHTLNYALNGIPGLGYSLDDAGQSFQNGDPAGGVGKTLGIATNLIAPKYASAAVNAVGKGLKGAAVPVAESALGISSKQRGFGKTPGAAVLDETTGIRPQTVAASARDKLASLSSDLESRAAASTTPASLQPARDVISNRAKVAAAGNSSYTPDELNRMQSHLTDPQPGFAGAVDPATGQIAVDQSPANILRMKREFGKDFTKWNPLNPSGEMGTARNAYRALDDELDRTVPGADSLNQRISSLIPAAERAESTDLNAGVTQNVMHRAAAHTGALIGTAAGYHAGGVPGAVAGLVIPEVLSSPEARMIAARGIHGAGKALASPVAGSAATATAGAAVGATMATRMGQQIRQTIDNQEQQ